VEAGKNRNYSLSALNLCRGTAQVQARRENETKEGFEVAHPMYLVPDCAWMILTSLYQDEVRLLYIFFVVLNMRHT